MNKIQQIHWKLTMDYLGHPYYVSGNAIYHALGMQLEPDLHQHISASHGMFVPGQWGRFPEEHSRDGVRPYMGASLPNIEVYDDLFLFRHPHNQWLLNSRPRDALNTHDIRSQSGRPALAHETIMGKPPDARKQQQTTKWYINAYLYTDRNDILPLKKSVLDGLQFGGKRNHGYGITRLKDTQVINLDEVDFTRIDDGSAFRLELVTPFVLESEYPGADDQPFPWWWSADRTTVREREEKVVEQREVYRLQTVDHGQVVAYEGNCPVETAKRGILRVGTHSKYGFGEFRVKPVDPCSQTDQKSVNTAIFGR